MFQMVRVTRLLVDRQEVEAVGDLCVMHGIWNVEILASTTELPSLARTVGKESVVDLIGEYIELDMTGANGIEYSGVGLVKIISVPVSPGDLSRVTVVGHGELTY